MAVDSAPLTDPRMKSYPTTIDAIRDFLAYAKEAGGPSAREMEHKQIQAGYSKDQIISEQMLRAFARGDASSFDARRAENFCRAMGIKVYILNEEIPDGFQAPQSPTEK